MLLGSVATGPYSDPVRCSVILTDNYGLETPSCCFWGYSVGGLCSLLLTCVDVGPYSGFPILCCSFLWMLVPTLSPIRCSVLPVGLLSWVPDPQRVTTSFWRCRPLFAAWTIAEGVVQRGSIYIYNNNNNNNNGHL